MNAVLRDHVRRTLDEHDRDMRLAWHIEALRRAKRVPPLRRLLSRRKKRPATYAPAAMSDERRRRLELLSRGLTLATDVDAYARPEDDR